MNYSKGIVAAMTSKKKDFPTRVQLKDDSFVIFDQIGTISIQRIKKVTDTKLSKKKMIKTMLVD